MFRILVAEDDKGTRRLMQDTLADAGYEPLPAADGQQALELLGQKHVDLMVLDVMMPKLDGFFAFVAAAQHRQRPSGTGADRQGSPGGTSAGAAAGRRRLYGRGGASAAHRGRCCAGAQAISRPAAGGGRHRAGLRRPGGCAGTDAPPCCPARSSSFCTSCCPAPARPLPPPADGTRSGTWTPTVTSTPSTCTSTGCGTGSRTTGTLPS